MMCDNTHRVSPTRDTHVSLGFQGFYRGVHHCRCGSLAMELTLVSSTSMDQGPTMNHTVSTDSLVLPTAPGKLRLLSAKTLQGLSSDLLEPGVKGPISLGARGTLSCLVGPHRLFQLPENFCENLTSGLELLNLCICGIPVVTRKSHWPSSRREPKSGVQPLRAVQGAGTMADMNLKGVKS